MKTCKRQHEYRGDENYRARTGRCPVCFREVQRRYEKTSRARERHHVYDLTDKGGRRRTRYLQSPQGWLNALRNRRAKSLKRRAKRTEAEDSNG